MHKRLAAVILALSLMLTSRPASAEPITIAIVTVWIVKAVIAAAAVEAVHAAVNPSPAIAGPVCKFGESKLAELPLGDIRKSKPLTIPESSERTAI